MCGNEIQMGIVLFLRYDLVEELRMLVRARYVGAGPGQTFWIQVNKPLLRRGNVPVVVGVCEDDCTL